MSTLKRKAAAEAGGDAKKARQNGNIASFFGAPKPVAAPTAKAPAFSAFDAPAVKFNKEKWVASLTPEQRDLLQLEIDTLDVSWLTHLKEDITSPEFLNLKKFLAAETKAGKKWFPPAEDVYSWSRHTPFQDVKVVIVGQDPYHNINQAHGMAFSVRPPTPAPPSLRNMYKALAKDYPSFVPPPNKGGYLMPWADRGVLMLNTCLTVRAHDAYSHANRGWEKLTQKIIDLIAKKRTRGVVYMAWGAPAAKRVQKIDKSRHLVLNSVHPSPLSASRGFFDCGHFRKANDWLVKRYGDEGEIDWALNPGNTTKAPKKVENEARKEIEDADEFDDDEEALEEALRLAEEVTKNEVAENEVFQKEDVQKEDVQKEDVQEEDVQKEDVQKEDVQKENTQKEVAQKDLVKQEDPGAGDTAAQDPKAEDTEKEDTEDEDDERSP